jgi:hypothetical protein
VCDDEATKKQYLSLGLGVPPLVSGPLCGASYFHVLARSLIQDPYGSAHPELSKSGLRTKCGALPPCRLGTTRRGLLHTVSEVQEVTEIQV